MSVYYNLFQNNQTITQIPMIMNKNLTAPLIKRQSDYDICVTDFSIPTTTIPLLHFKSNNYYVALSYGLFCTSLIPIVYDSTLTGRTDDQNIYNIVQFIYMLNTTITTAWTALKALTTVPGVCPYFYFNPITQLTSCVTDTNYLVGTTPQVKIGFNLNLLRALEGFCYSVSVAPLSSLGIRMYQLKLIDQKFNSDVPSSGLYTNTQESFNLNSFTDVVGLYIMTNLSIRNEWQDQSTQKPILMEWFPEQLTLQSFHFNAIYHAETPYRQVSLISDDQINNLTCYVYYVLTDGTFNLVKLGPNSSAYIKLMFTLKESNKYA